MQIDDLVDSTIMQLYPIDFARKLVETFINTQMANIDEVTEKKPEQPENDTTAQIPAPGTDNQTQMNNTNLNGMNQMGNMGMNSMNQMGMMGMPGQNVNVQPAQFQSFSNDNMGTTGQENIGLIKDVPLEVTVELGRTTKSISDILDFSPGTIIELDRIAGEPIDVLVNGKFVAKGEVVVIEESFGVRITEIIK